MAQMTLPFGGTATAPQGALDQIAANRQGRATIQAGRPGGPMSTLASLRPEDLRWADFNRDQAKEFVQSTLGSSGAGVGTGLRNRFRMAKQRALQGGGGGQGGGGSTPGRAGFVPHTRGGGGAGTTGGAAPGSQNGGFMGGGGGFGSGTSTPQQPGAGGGARENLSTGRGDREGGTDLTDIETGGELEGIADEIREAAGDLERSESQSGTGRLGQEIYEMAKPGLENVSGFFGQLAGGDFAGTPEGQAQKAGIARSIETAKDKIRQRMAERGITDERFIQDQMAQAELAGGRAQAEIPLRGRAMAQQFLPRLASTASQFQYSKGMGASPTAGISGLSNIGQILQNQQSSISDLLQSIGYGQGYGGASGVGAPFSSGNFGLAF